MKRLLLLFFICLFLCSCSDKRYSTQIFGYFDTVVSVDGYFENEKEFEKACAIIENTLSDYHNALDIHSKNGEAAILNSRKSLTVSTMLLDAIHFGIKVNEVTFGNCNIAMGAVLEEWHKARENGVLPDFEVLEDKAKYTNIENIEISGNTVTLLDENMSLDFGAIAKGYVADLLKESLKGYNMIINLGGNVLVLGDKDGSGWKVGVQDPENENALSKTLTIKDTSLVTSGVYQRYFEYEGKRYHHIISPDTLYPSDNYLSVTVLYESSAWADALSTALFNMSIEEGKEILENFDDIGVMWIKNDGNIEYYGNIKDV